MAATPEGARLTEQHRLEQQAVRAAFLAEFIALWALLDSNRLDDTSPGWIAAVARLVTVFRARSAQSATRYYVTFRGLEAPEPARPFVVPRIELPAGVERPTPTPATQPQPQPQQDPRPTRIDTRRTSTPAAQNRSTPRDQPARATSSTNQNRQTRVNFPDLPPAERRRGRVEIPELNFTREDRAVKVSLEVTGPVAQKSKTRRGKPLEVARDESFDAAAGAASRHVLTGGRKSLLTLIEGDMQAVGWARVTDGDPCAFCAMLASRGAVFGSAATAGFKAHDHCACTAEPAYSRSSPLPGRGAEFKRLWNDNIRGKYSGQDAINAWRRMYEQMRRDQRRTDVA